MTFRYPMLVRWSDIDSYDHVNNVRYFDYFQEARIAFLARILDTVAEGYFDAYPVVLAHQSVNYLRPILLRHPPYVGSTSYTLGSRIVDHGQDLVYARATSVLVAVDGETHAKRALTEGERTALTRHLAD
jgi:acyl-CoA thioester hydrolase